MNFQLYQWNIEEYNSRNTDKHTRFQLIPFRTQYSTLGNLKSKSTNPDNFI